MIRMLLYICILMGIFEGSPIAWSNTGTLLVEIESLRNTRGQVKVGLYDSDRGFPGSHSVACRLRIVSLRQRTVVVPFTDLPFGNYAVSILHDEDGDGAMKRNFIGLPCEGYGISRNPRIRFKVPSFADAMVPFESDSVRITITMKY